MGTPDFALDCLKSLCEAGHDVCGVFTQPDKPVGRKQILTPPPVKALAEEFSLPVYQPGTLRDGEAMRIIEGLRPELIVVVAFGKILPKEILDYPEYGCINIHASLLPHLRGAAPINFSIIEGLKETGVTSMYMNEGLDTGDIILQRKTQIPPDMTAGQLFDTLAPLGASVLVETIDALRDGSAKRTAQDESLATYAPTMSKQTGKIDFTKSAKNVCDLVRGCDPWPGAYCIYDEKELKIISAHVYDGAEKVSGEAGEVIRADKNGIVVACGDGAIVITSLQLPGKKRLPVRDFLNGRAMERGTRLS